MIERLKPYTEMKSAALEGLDSIPAHWETARLKLLLQERDSRSLDGSEQLLRVSQYTGVTERKPADGAQKLDTRAESLIGYKRVERHDLVVNIMLAWNGSMGVSDFPGIVSPAYCVYRFKSKTHPRYFHYLLRSVPYKARIKAESRGVIESRLRLYTDDLFRLEAHLPPRSEQTAIACFLDHMDIRIQRYMRAKEKLIELLDEYKQALIHQAVTGQINVRTGRPYTEYKDSGVEWLGSIPKHWRIPRLRSLADIETGGRDTINRVDDGRYPFFVRSQTVEKIDSWSFDGEAVLTAGDGVGVGKVFHYANEKFDYHQRVYKFSGFRAILGRFFFHYFRSTLRHEVFQGTAKSTVDSLRLPMLQNFPVLLPPRHEQNAIVRYLEHAPKKIGSTSERISRSLGLLRDYRARLISDVVTGKFDVRKAAADFTEFDLRNCDQAGDASMINSVIELDEATTVA